MAHAKPGAPAPTPPITGNLAHHLAVLSQRLHAARAVSACLSDASAIAPSGHADLAHLDYLCHACEELLDLAITACTQLETHLEGA